MKCKCIKSSKWFKINDSESSTNNGGPYEFIVGEIYKCELIQDGWGDSYSVESGPHKTIFGTNPKISGKLIFNNFFELI